MLQDDFFCDEADDFLGNLVVGDVDAGDAGLMAEEFYEIVYAEIAKLDEAFDDFSAVALLCREGLFEHTGGNDVFIDQEVADSFGYGGICLGSTHE